MAIISSKVAIIPLILAIKSSKLAIISFNEFNHHKKNFQKTIANFIGLLLKWALQVHIEKNVGGLVLPAEIVSVRYLPFEPELVKTSVGNIDFKL